MIRLQSVISFIKATKPPIRAAEAKESHSTILVMEKIKNYYSRDDFRKIARIEMKMVSSERKFVNRLILSFWKYLKIIEHVC